MKQTSFYYVPDVGIDNVTGEPVEVMRPKIPIRLIINHKVFPQVIEALFDTGSDRNLFPADIAKSMGVNVTKGDAKKIGGIGQGNPIDAYTHNVTILVANQKVSTDIDFSFKQNIPILGRVGFMDKFPLIEINQKGKFIKIYYP
jgi:hypothetical protein